MKKIISAIISAVILLSAFSINAFAEELPQMQVEVKAKAALLMEAETGEVLMAQNAHEKLSPASVTKIMTLLLVTEAVDDGRIALTDTVTASAEASKKGGSQIWLEDGEQMSVDDLLKATAVASANDACTALGEYVAGSDAAFVKMMNERAKELGMNDTNFENCTGLDDTAENHVTSAYDVALMSRELMKHQRIINYTTIRMDALRGGETELVNTNKLIRFYEGATGLKTGTTSKAGCCVSATATRDGLSLIAVVLGSDNSQDRFDGAEAMLDWGFANYSAVTLTPDPSLITDVNVLNGCKDVISPVIPDGVNVIVEKGREKDIAQSVDISVSVEAPVEEKQTLGTVTFTLDGREIGSCRLVSGESVQRLTFFEQFRRYIKSMC